MHMPALMKAQTYISITQMAESACSHPTHKQEVKHHKHTVGSGSVQPVGVTAAPQTEPRATADVNEASDQSILLSTFL